jgi:hypothetical protein
MHSVIRNGFLTHLLAPTIDVLPQTAATGDDDQVAFAIWMTSD